MPDDLTKEAFFRLLVDSSAEAFYAVDRAGVTTLCNPTFLRMLGFSSETDAVGRKLHDVIHHTRADGAHYDASDCPIYRCAETGVPAHVDDESFHRIDGTVVPVEYWARPIVVAGELMGAICTFLDVSERRRAEQRLRDLNADLERQVTERAQERALTWQISPELMSVLNRDGTIALANPTWQSLLGWSEDELRAMPPFALLHPDDAAANRAAFDRLCAGEPISQLENRKRCKDGSYRWLSWLAVPQTGKLYYSARDITAQKDQANALLRAEEALRQAQKMEAIGQLTGGIAHDFNNLLTGIIGALDIVRRRIAANRLDDLPRFMHAASSSAQRAAALTNRLLAFARRQSLDTRPNDVNRLVAGMQDLLERTLGKGIDLQITLAADLWAASTDSNQLENAILNLAINARDAMPHGGRLTIETANIRLDEAYARREPEVTPGDYVMMSVSDTGSGMSADVIGKALDPFFTTKPIGQGTGLGLSMIYGFVRQSRGHLRLSSQEGRGTTIKLYFARALVEQPDHVGDDTDTPRGEGETVLVVEDDATVRLLIIDVLEELGYRHLDAPDAATAIPLLQSARRIDLLVTDVGLPHVNGRQLAEIARAARPNLRVLFVTGYAETATFRGDFLAAGMDMLTKPFALDDLGIKIRAMLQPAGV